MKVILTLILWLSMMFFASTFLVGFVVWVIDANVTLKITMGQSFYLFAVSCLFNVINSEASQ
jgi:hypothetical protein